FGEKSGSSDNEESGRAKLDVRIKPGWSSHGPGDGAPDRVFGTNQPVGTDAGLHLKSAEVIVLEFGADGDAQTIASHGELILYERGRQWVGPARRVERKHRC